MAYKLKHGPLSSIYRLATSIYKVSLQWKTAVSQTTPADCIPSWLASSCAFELSRCNTAIHWTESLPLMRQYACWMGMPSDTTVALTGKHTLPQKSAGDEKNHLRVLLTAQANRTKMKPSVVFKGKGTQLKDLQHIHGIVVHFSSNEWTHSPSTACIVLLVSFHSPNISCMGHMPNGKLFFNDGSKVSKYCEYLSWCTSNCGGYIRLGSM